jgi:putative FmdB family regulatory protein
MPFYEYRCDNCSHEMEALQKLSDPPLLECPECGQPSLRKLISAAGFRLKGGGWYETDFKKSGKKNLHEAGGTDTGGGGSETRPSAGKSESSADTGPKQAPENKAAEKKTAV